MITTPMDMARLHNLESRSASFENPTGASGAGGTTGNGRKGFPAKEFAAGEKVTLMSAEGSGMVRHIWMTMHPGAAEKQRRMILRAWWDGNSNPAIEVPLPDFFGIAHGRQRPYHSMLTTQPEGRGFNNFMAMPFGNGARMELENMNDEPFSLFYQVDYTLGDPVDDNVGRLHIQFRRQNPTRLKDDYAILPRTKGRGVFLGCVVGVRTLKPHWYGEGEVKVYLDGDDTHPTICGTGLEDYVGTAWGMGQHAGPYQGAPLVCDDLISFYRWHVPDPIYFQESIKVTIQQMGYGPAEWLKEQMEQEGLELAQPMADDAHGGLFEREDDYCSAAFWYHAPPGATLEPLPGKDELSAHLEQRQAEKPQERQDV